MFRRFQGWPSAASGVVRVAWQFTVGLWPPERMGVRLGRDTTALRRFTHVGGQRLSTLGIFTPQSNSICLARAIQRRLCWGIGGRQNRRVWIRPRLNRQIPEGGMASRGQHYHLSRRIANTDVIPNNESMYSTITVTFVR